jgi:hypothetical protein
MLIRDQNVINISSGNMAGLSGGQGMVYTEFSKPRLALFKQRYKK